MRSRDATAGSERERGSISVFAAVLAVAMILVIGLVVDGGAKIHAQAHAQAAAREAARAGGQAVSAAAAVRGDGARADPTAARSAALDYLAGAGVSGTVTITGGTRLVVNTTATYDPVFLSIAGLGTQTVTGHAEARLVRAVGGTER